LAVQGVSDFSFPWQSPAIVPQVATVSPKRPVVPTQVTAIVPQLAGTGGPWPVVSTQVAPVQTDVMAFMTDLPVIAPDLTVLMADPGGLRHQGNRRQDQGAGEQQARQQFQAFHTRILGWRFTP
jgi:hypothetical protein